MAEQAFSLDRIVELLHAEDLDAWLELWRLSQGGSSRSLTLDLITEVIPFSVDEAVRVLDMCCGPGGLGRLVRGRFPNSQIDLLDRDTFLLALAVTLNKRANIAGNIFIRDAWSTSWREGIAGKYHVICTATALHWFDARRLRELFKDFLDLLRPGGVLLFSEPTHTLPPFDASHQKWSSARENRYDIETWDQF